jgi:hypothetical protein
MNNASLEYRECFESYGVAVGIESNSLTVLRNAVRTATSALLEDVRPVNCSSAAHWFRLVDEGGRCSIFQDGQRMVTDETNFKFWKFFDSLVRILIAEHAKNMVFVHAGVVGWRDRAIVFPGNSFQGKTTLVAELIKHGALYYSDEYAVIDEHGLVHPFARPLTLRNSVGTIRETPTNIEVLGGDAGTRPLPVGSIFFTTFKKSAKWAPERLSPGQGVIEMVPQTIPIRANSEFVVKVMTLVAGGALIVKTDRGEASEFAGYFLDFVDNTTI